MDEVSSRCPFLYNPVLGIRDVYPGSWFLPIPDLGSRIQNSNKRQGWKKICCHNFFFQAINFTKLNYFIFEMLKKKIWASFQRIIELFTQKIITKLSEIWVWDPRSGIRKKPIPNPGSRGQKGTGSRIRIRNTDTIICFLPRWILFDIVNWVGTGINQSIDQSVKIGSERSRLSHLQNLKA